MDEFVDNYAPTTAMSWSEYYNYRGKQANGDQWVGMNPDSFGANFSNFFTGDKDTWYKDYQKYLDDLNRSNDYNATQSARAWELYLDSTKYQRALEDIKKAGLNPWLLVQNGSLSANGSTSAEKTSTRYNKPTKDEKGDAGRNLALFFLATAKILATLL